mmetsp:Transcript_62334/g.135331  ORF Transcript_62334/g.135331 Transcript_62334/m.135331 type:complete len:534 (-) Transcript_62334:105-1706(-)
MSSPPWVQPDAEPEPCVEASEAAVKLEDVTFAERVTGKGNGLVSNVGALFLRAVKVSTVMQGFGGAFSTASGMLQVTLGDYERSKTVEKIDDFISHCWQTGRWGKFLSLCWVYNFRAAAIVSWLAAVAVFILEMDSVSFLPRTIIVNIQQGGQMYETNRGFWCVLLCPSIFLLVAVFGQDLIRTRMVFVDKFCINQVDPNLKDQGIQGLEGILRQSERLVLLWTPAYLDRLKCSYELASWLYVGKSHIVFMPVCFATLATALIAGLLAHYLLTRICQVVMAEVPLPVTCLSLGMVSVIMAFFARSVVRELAQLPSQLSSYSVERTRCFCCEHGHVHPTTKQDMHCDRKLVYDVLKERFLKEEGKSEDFDWPLDSEAFTYLDYFDAQVRRRFDQYLMPSGFYKISYQHCLIVASPAVWSYLDQAAYLESLPSLEMLRWALYVGSMIFAVIPACLQLFLLVCSYFEGICVRFGDGLLPRLLSTLASATTSCFILLSLVGLLTFPFENFSSILPMIVASGVVSLPAVLLFRTLQEF